MVKLHWGLKNLQITKKSPDLWPVSINYKIMLPTNTVHFWRFQVELNWADSDIEKKEKEKNGHETNWK